MKYLDSVTKSTLKTSFTSKCIFNVMLSVFLVYLLLQLTGYTILFITFPGYVNDGSTNDFELWKGNLLLPIYFSCWCMFMILSILSGLITIYALREILNLVN